MPMDVAINRDDWAKIAYTQATGCQKCPLLVLAGLAWLKLELRFEGLKQLATSNNMAGQAFAEQDHMPTALLRWEHAVEGGD